MSDKITLTCDIIKKYYNSLWEEYDDAIFSNWCDDNGFDDETVELEFEEYDDNNPQDWQLADFDENDTFPFNYPPATEDDKYRTIHKLLEKFWNNCDNPKVSFNFTAKVPEFKKSTFEITEDDITNIKDIYRQQCPALFNSGMETDRCFLKLLAIGYKNNFNYLQCLVDDYFRDRIEHIKDKEPFKVPDWRKNHKHFKEIAKIPIGTVQTECDKIESFKSADIKAKKKTIPDLVSGAVHSFGGRVCPALQFQPMTQINDSLDIVTKYIEAGFIFVASVFNEASQMKTKRAICPFQIDICIALNEPKDVQKMQGMDNNEAKNEEDEDDEKDETEQAGAFVDCVGDICEKLEVNKLKYKCRQIPAKETNFEQGRVFLKLFNEFEDANNDSKINDKYYYLHKKRLVAFVDRRMDRKKQNKKKQNEQPDVDDVYLYEPPSNCASIPQNAVSEWYISASKTCLLPNIEYGDGKAAVAAFDKNNKAFQEVDGKAEKVKLEDSNIGSSFHCKGALLTISFHVKSTEEIKCYLYLGGQMTRFMPSDIKTVFPKLFNMDFDGNKDFIGREEIDDRISVMNKIIKDLNFKGFQQSFM